MKKRISIVTWLGDGNYGTALQAFALKHKVETLGHEAQLLYKIGVVRSIKSAIGNLLFWKRKEKTESEQILDAFWRQYGNVRIVYSLFPKTKLRKETDLFLNGSDQVWNTYFYFDPFYFLSFAGDKRKAAYASSIGTDRVNPKYEKQVCAFLKDFSHIGMREESGVKALSEITGRKDIRQVVDPTFLIDSEEWKSISKEYFPKVIKDKYLLVYLIGDNKEYQEAVEELARKNNLDNIIVIDSKESGTIVGGTRNISFISPLGFVALIQNAALVCTDSFHATAISINSGRDFVVLKRFSDTDKASQNSRLYDLLSRYQLTDRLYSQGMELTGIDYARVHNLLERDIKDSEEFLIKTIGND